MHVLLRAKDELRAKQGTVNVPPSLLKKETLNKLEIGIHQVNITI